MYLVAVKLRMGGKRLAQVGHFEDGRNFQAVPPVPVRTKLRGNESVEDAADRIKATKFPTLELALKAAGHIFVQETSA